MEPQSGLRTWQWVVTAIVVIILIVIGVMVFGKDSPEDETPDNTNATSTVSNTPGVNAIVMSDQYPGNVVYLSSVQLSKAGWVEIHKDNKGQPGEIIGTAWVDAGVNPVKVTLTSPIVDGGTYYAMLHSDDGDKKFDAAKDLPLKDANGNVIMRIFKGSVNADQNTKG
jgi:hypothetical protein